MDSLYIVMPAYNEEANIRSVVDEWYPLLEGKDERSRLVVADGGSSDGTHRILLEMQKSHPKLVILEKSRTYHGPKLLALYGLAVRDGIDYVFQTDSDGQTDPSEFAAFWEKRGDYDGIFGSRPVRGDGQSRAFVEKVVCHLLKHYFGISVPDANAPFRLMRCRVLSKYLNRMRPDYNLPNIMLVTFFIYYGERSSFREISFRRRRAGKNSIDIPKITRIGLAALRDFRHFRKEMKKG